MKRRKKEAGGADESWIPVPRGKTYCSPACGRGCARREYDRAVRDADHLVRRLRGSGWRAVVWENLGWHYRAVSGTVQVYGCRLTKDRRPHYHCMISHDVDRPLGGSVIWTDRLTSYFPNPNVAVKVALSKVLEVTSGVLDAARSACEAVGISKLNLLLLSRDLRRAAQELRR
jgi:hypothetical protein